MRVINFAHGDIMAVGALTTVSLVAGYALPFWLALILVPILTAGIGLAIQYLILRRIAGAPMIMSLLATYAISTILVNASILIWGGGYRVLPGVLGGSVRIFGVDISHSRLMAFLVALGVSLAVWWVLEKTRFGRAVRSVSQAPEIAEISGISLDRVRNATFALGAAMAGLAGVLMAPTLASDPQLGARFVVKAFAVIIVGGMGSYPGAILAALFLGVVEVVGGYWAGAVIGSALLYLLMLVVLLLRPRGLLGVGMRA
jgi:branched-chain amino acid transport system permease protein